MSYNETYMNEAKNAYSRLTGGIINFFSLSKDNLKSFFEVQKEKNAFSTFNLGLQEVEVSKIVGSVQKNTDFNSEFIPINKIVETRWCNIYAKYLEDGNLPPVELYKIKDEYFVYDGNHRVSVAKALNFKTIDAIVTEYVPNTDEEADLIYNEKFFFIKQTNIKDINFSYVGGYKILMAEINFYKNILTNENEEIDFYEVSHRWRKKVFSPIVRIMRYLPNMRDLPNGNLYSRIALYLRNHPNISITRAVLETIDYYNLVMTEPLMRQFRKLEILDVNLNKNINLPSKIEFLEEFIGIPFVMPLKFIREIENFNPTSTFETNTENWYANIFLKRYSFIEKRINLLPAPYKKMWIKIDNAERINLEIIEYKKVFQIQFSRELSEMEIILNYIIEIYIPITNLLSTKSNIGDLYYLISEKYRQLHNYKKIVTMDEAYDYVMKQMQK